MQELIVREDFSRVKALVLNGLTSEHSRRAYSRALTHFLTWYALAAEGEGLCKATVQRYARSLGGLGMASSTINQHLSAVRKLAMEAADNGLLAGDIALGVSHVHGAKAAGIRTGNWLTLDQAGRLLAAPDPARLIGQRDRAMLAVLIGCGLRRSEASAMTFAHVQQRDGRWAIVDLCGKGGRVRTVPMPAWCKAELDAWTAAAKLDDGLIFRAMNNKGQLLDTPLHPQNILEAVTRYGKQIGVPRLAPHDLRRTFAKLAHKGRAALEQIQLSLGHATILTTERYLGVRQDMQDAPCDHLGLKRGGE